MTIKLSKMAHIKAVVPDANKAFQILNEIFGAVKIKEDFENSFVKVIKIGLGDFILQYIEPIAQEGPFYEQLKTKGPGIFSLAFVAENIDEIEKKLENDENIHPILSKTGIGKEYFGNIPLDFINPNVKTEIIFNTIEKIGFNLELGEKHAGTESIFLNAQYVTGSDKTLGDASTMLHFELVTENAENAYEFLHRNFGSEMVEIIFANMLDSEFMHIIHVNLVNQVLQYCQPIGKTASWYELLQKSGPYIHNLNFAVNDIEATVEKLKKKGFAILFQQKLTPEDETFFYMIATIEVLGFHLEPWQWRKEGTPDGFAFVDMKKD